MFENILNKSVLNVVGVSSYGSNRQMKSSVICIVNDLILKVLISKWHERTNFLGATPA